MTADTSMQATKHALKSITQRACATRAANQNVRAMARLTTTIAIAAAALALAGCGGGDPADCRVTDSAAPAELRLALKGATYAASVLDYSATQAGSLVTVAGSFDLSVEGYGDAEIIVRARLYDSLSTTQFDAVVAVVKTIAGSSHKSRVVVPDFSWRPSSAPRTAVLYVYWQSTGTDAFVTLRNRSITVNECSK